jgi:hypothetical protein
MREREVGEDLKNCSQQVGRVVSWQMLLMV